MNKNTQTCSVCGKTAYPSHHGHGIRSVEKLSEGVYREAIKQDIVYRCENARCGYGAIVIRITRRYFGERASGHEYTHRARLSDKRYRQIGELHWPTVPGHGEK